MTLTKIQKLTPWLLLGLVCMVLVVVVLWPVPKQDRPEANVTLPESNKQQAIPEGYLYASQQPLRELLTDLDIYFKAQGLVSDKDSQVFEYARGVGEGQQPQPQSCVVFAYFREDKPAVAFTLIPENSVCFSEDVSTQDKIRSLQRQFEYVYAITPSY